MAIQPGNKIAIVRALEIYEIAKKPKTEIISGPSIQPVLSLSKGPAPRVMPSDASEYERCIEVLHEQKKCSYDLLMIGLSMGREELKKRIGRRVEEMIEQGWIDEVRDLLARGYRPTDPGMESHGYREICAFLEEVEEGEEDIEEAKERLKQRITTKTCQYAKRQMTWWRKDMRIHWLNESEG